MEIRAFNLDAKAEISAFVTEQRLAGAVRASLVGKRNFAYLSNDAESGSARKPAELQNRLASMAHGFTSVPAAVVCDARNGGAVEETGDAPWFLAALEKSALDAARDSLGALGLTPADITVATPLFLGVIAGTLAQGEEALVVVPGEDDATLVWVSSDGVRAVAAAPLGYGQIFDAVQKALGLKFKAAAGKLFYNTNYDFSDTAPAITRSLAELLRVSLEGSSARILHVASMTPAQAWLGNGLADALGLKVWAPDCAAMAARLGLTVGGGVDAGAAGLLALAGAGTSNAPWVQPTLEVLAERPPVRGKTAAAVARGDTTPPVAVVEKVQVTTSDAKAPAAAVVAAQPVATPAAKRVETTVTPVVSTPVLAQVSRPAESASMASRVAPPPTARSKNGPILIGVTVAVVASVVGLAMYFRSPRDRGSVPAPVQQAAPVAAAEPTPSAAPAPSPATPAPAPTPASTAEPVAAAPVVSNEADRSGAEARLFSNARYRLEVTEKGAIQALALSTSSEAVLVESAAGISLQRSSVGTDGRLKWFNVGGSDEAEYVASVNKSVVNGATVFDVKVTHPRFEMNQTFTCLESSVKVSANFTPIDLSDSRGMIVAVHSVRLSPAALSPSLRMRPEGDAFVYSVTGGEFGVAFDSSVWGRDGADGRETVIAGESGVAFHFTETADRVRRVLNYELRLP